MSIPVLVLSITWRDISVGKIIRRELLGVVVSMWVPSTGSHIKALVPSYLHIFQGSGK